MEKVPFYLSVAAVWDWGYQSAAVLFIPSKKDSSNTGLRAKGGTRRLMEEEEEGGRGGRWKLAETEGQTVYRFYSHVSPSPSFFHNSHFTCCGKRLSGRGENSLDGCHGPNQKGNLKVL